MNARAVITFGGLALLIATSRAGADGDDDGFVLPVGFSPHVKPAKDGRIDWAEGAIFSEGLGKGPGRNRRDQEKLLAQRAAETVAGRNAILIANGIQVDADGRFENVRNGEVHVGGRIKGHKTVSVVWRKGADPVECVATIKVPIWGVKGVAAVVHAGQVQKFQRLRRRHLVLAGGDADVSDEILVIDARGSGAEPCLYPVLIGPDGGVLYDISRFDGGGQPTAPPVRYVETAMTYEVLQACLQGGEENGMGTASPVYGAQLGFFGTIDSTPQWDLWQSAESTAVAAGGGLSALFMVNQPPATPTAGPTSQRATSQRATSQPSTQPRDESNRRRRRRAVKAVKATGNSKTEIVLTREDAERLRNDPRGANLLKKGQVYVVMDAAAAGIQGRLDRSPDESVLALLGPR